MGALFNYMLFIWDKELIGTIRFSLYEDITLAMAESSP